MSDIRRAIDEIGSWYDPPSPRISRSATEGAHRAVSSTLLTIGIAMGVALIGGALLFRAFVATPGSERPATAPASPVPPDCPPHEGPFLMSIAPASGPVGSRVSITGPLPLWGEGGEEAGHYLGPPAVVEVWWNADPDKWVDLAPGGRPPSAEEAGSDVLLLAEADTSSACSLAQTVTVPDAQPGDYHFVVIQVGADGSRASFLPVDFHVEP